MSRVIDERVVSMQFDNRQFEKNVSTTMSTIDKLKQKLRFSGANKGFDEINESAKKTNLSPLATGLDALQSKFSALQVVGITALANITNSAVNTGKKIASALTLDPLISGFSEYETKMGSIQTILANTQSKGSTLNDVNDALNELNTYADKTIYNFTEMTKNIGTFTAAGVDLDKSVTSIKGIANLAAISGSTSQQASNAMYQLSQALAAGKVSLMDWDSVVSAGMGGEVFQTALKRTATQMGYNVDALIDKYGSFRESLTKGEWLTAEVLTETLTQLSGAYTEADLIAQGYTEEQAKQITDLAKTAVGAATEVKTFTALVDTTKEALQSGWSNSWEIIIGNYEEAKELYTGINNFLNEAINKSAESRNNLLQGWKDLGGRTDLLDGLKNIVEGISSIVTPIREAFRDVFPPATAETLYNITKSFKELTEKFKISDKTATNLKNTFKGIFSVLSLIINTVKTVIKGVLTLTGSLLGLSDGVLSITGKIGNFITELVDGVKNANIFGKAIDGLTTFIKTLINVISEIGSTGFSKLGSVFGGVLSIIKNIGSKLFEIIKIITDGLFNALKTGDLNNLAKLFNQGILATILLSLKKFITNFTDIFDSFNKKDSFLDKLKSAFDSITGVLDTTRKSLETWQKNLQASILLKIAVAIGILAASLVVLSTIDKDKLESSLGAITVLFIELISAMSLINKITSGGKIKSASSAVIAMIGMASAMFILALSVKKLSDLKPEELVKGLLGVAGMAVILISISKILSKGTGTIIKGTSNLIIFAAAIKLMASVVKDLAYVKEENIIKGLTAIGILMAEISLFAKKTDTSTGTFRFATGILLMSTSLKILSSVTKELGSMDVKTLAKGLSSIGILLTEFSLATRVIGKSDKLISTAVTITIISASLKLLGSVFSDLSKFSWNDIAKSLTAIIGSLSAITLSFRALPKKDLFWITGALPTLASALVIVAQAFDQIDDVSWDGVIKGIIAISTSMGVLVASMIAIKSVGDFSFQLLVTSAALIVMASALSVIGSLGLIGVASSLAGLAGMFIIIGTSAKLLGPASITILKLSASIAALSVSLAALGTSLVILGAGSLSFITSFVAMIALMNTLKISDIAKGILTLAGVFVTVGISAYFLGPLAPTLLSLSASLGIFALSCLAVSVAISALTFSLIGLASVGEEGAKAIIVTIKELLKGIPEIIPLLSDIIVSFIVSIIDTLKESIPSIVDGLLSIVLDILKSLYNYAPQIIDFILLFIIDIINGLTKRVPELITSLANLLGAIFSSIGNAIKGVDTNSLIQAIGAVTILTILIKLLSTVPAYLGGAMVGLLGIGVLIAELSLILAAIGGLAQISGLSWLIQEGGNFLQLVGTAIGQFIGGIIGGVASGISSSFPKIGTYLSEFMINVLPFIEGAKLIDSSVMQGVNSLCQMILVLTAAELIDSLTSWLTGGSSMTDFAEELVPFGKAITEFSQIISGNIDESAVTSAANAGKILAEMASTLPNSGGVVGFFVGENDLDTFAEQIVPFGKAITEFSSIVAGNIDENAVSAAANAGKMMSEMASTLPNSGGVVGFFVGENDLDTFAEQIVPFGKAITEFSQTVAGNINEDAILAASNAGKMMSEMASTIPNSGGVISFFTGDNDLRTFADQLVIFGLGMSAYSRSLDGVDTDAMNESAIAAKALVEVANSIENNSGGFVSLFTGEKSIKDIGYQLVPFGEGLKLYSESVSDLDIVPITNSISAATSIVSLANSLSNSGGFISVFTGDKSLADIGYQLVPFGEGLKSYSETVSGLKTEPITDSMQAATLIVDLANSLSNSGGVLSIFSGDNSLSSLGNELTPFGEGLKNFSDKVTGINNEAIQNAVSSSKYLVEISNSLSNSGGMVSLFTGDNSLSSFGQELAPFGEGLKNFSDKVTGINGEDVQNAVPVAKSLVDIFNSLSNSGGFVSIFTGEKDFSNFSSQLGPFGEGLKTFGDAVTGINGEDAQKAVPVAQSLIDIFNSLSNSGGFVSLFSGDKDFSNFSSQLGPLGEGLKNFGEKVTDINGEDAQKAVTVAKNVLDLMTSISALNYDNVDNFVYAINSLGEANVDAFIEAFSNKSADVEAAGAGLIESLNTGMKSKNSITTSTMGDILSALLTAIDDEKSEFLSKGKETGTEFISGIEDEESTAIDSIENLLESIVSSIEGYYDSFYDAAYYLVMGFANAINDYTYLAEARSRLMAYRAAEAARKELDENSPSKVGYEIGDFFGIAFVNAISDNIPKAYNASSDMAQSARVGLTDAMSVIERILDNDINIQPVITPVLDLSNIESKSSTLESMLDVGTSYRIMEKVDGVNSMMNQRIQNGRNSDIASAINKLNKKIDNMGNTYNSIDGITYDDGSNISNAMKLIIRQAKIERRA